MYVYTFISIYISSIYLEPQKVVFASFICFNKNKWLKINLPVSGLQTNLQMHIHMYILKFI